MTNSMSDLQKAIKKEFARISQNPLVEENLEEKLIKGSPILEFQFVPKSGGFEVDFTVEKDEYYFSADSWHEHGEYVGADNIKSPEEKAELAIAQLISLLNGQAYLEVTFRGRIPYKWTLCFGDMRNTTGLLFVPFWARKKVVTRRNNALKRNLKANPWL